MDGEDAMKGSKTRFGFFIFVLIPVMIEAIASTFAWYVILILFSLPTLLWGTKWVAFILSHGIYVAGVGGVLHILFHMQSIIEGAQRTYEAYLRDLQAMQERGYHCRRPPLVEYIWQGIREAWRQTDKNVNKIDKENSDSFQ